MQNKLIEIRDLRNQDWLWTSKKLLFHEKIDGNNYKVYGGLAAYANNDTQEAFPSIDTLSEKLHMSRNTVMRSLKVLEETKFIKIEKKIGEHNVYVLLSDCQREGTCPVPEEKKEEKPKTTTPIAENGINLFERFWAIYPNHANKKTAQLKFKKLSNATIKKMVLDVKNRKENHDQWLKGIIPHLSTYINQERWNDPIVKPNGEKGGNKNTPTIHPDIKRKLFREGNTMRYNDTMEAENKVQSVGELLKQH